MTSGELTYGAVRDRLVNNGYVPCSALVPHGDIVLSFPIARQRSADYRIAEHPAAVLTYPDRENCSLADAARRRVVVLIVTAKDKALREAIAGIIEKHGLAGGPVRVGSDASEHRPLRWDEYDAPLSRSWRPYTVASSDDPAVVLEGAEKIIPGQPLVSALLRVDGKWSRGDLLTTLRAKLPVIDRDGIDALFRALGALPLATEPYVAPPPPVARPLSPSEQRYLRSVAPRSKRDFAGNPNVLMAHMAAVRAGHEVELPDRPPEA
jgi:hypothetical protein